MNYKVLRHAKVVISTDGSDRLGIDVGDRVIPLQETLATSALKTVDTRVAEADPNATRVFFDGLWMIRLGNPINVDSISHITFTDTDTSDQLEFTEDKICAVHMDGIDIICVIYAGLPDIAPEDQMTPVAFNARSTVVFGSDGTLPAGLWTVSPGSDYGEIDEYFTLQYEDISKIDSKYLPNMGVPHINVGTIIEDHKGDSTEIDFILPDDLAAPILKAFRENQPVIYITRTTYAGASLATPFYLMGNGTVGGYLENLLAGGFLIEGDHVRYHTN